MSKSLISLKITYFAQTLFASFSDQSWPGFRNESRLCRKCL